MIFDLYISKNNLRLNMLIQLKPTIAMKGKNPKRVAKVQAVTLRQI